MRKREKRRQAHSHKKRGWCRACRRRRRRRRRRGGRCLLALVLCRVGREKRRGAVAQACLFTLSIRRLCGHQGGGSRRRRRPHRSGGGRRRQCRRRRCRLARNDVGRSRGGRKRRRGGRKKAYYTTQRQEERREGNKDRLKMAAYDVARTHTALAVMVAGKRPAAAVAAAGAMVGLMLRNHLRSDSRNSSSECSNVEEEEEEEAKLRPQDCFSMPPFGGGSFLPSCLLFFFPSCRTLLQVVSLSLGSSPVSRKNDFSNIQYAYF